MPRATMDHLVAFLAVARERSFTRAAAQLGVSPSALSHAIRKLEERLGVRLLTRTTRSVSPTEAGERLVRNIGPHFDEIRAEVEGLSEFRDRPSGTVRITAGDHVSESILLPRIAQLLPNYPDLRVEISVDIGFVDIAAEGFDAGIRLGETVAQDMIAVRIGPDLCMAAVSAPSYFVDRPRPRTPHDLAGHNCINLRFPTHGGVYVWEFEKDGRPLNVRVEGQLVVNDIALARIAALKGTGIAYLPDDYVRPQLDSGELVRVLDDWCPPFPGYHLYYPGRRQLSPALAVIVEALRHRG
ncbi:LysR family transcriptional regulator [Sphingosinicella sp. CPCC 101087]|uniref:LysR family transcriptional regulator n=1 Tax=Sphingosinicella sp. CPCC 101087 TaxID=2497754 RepID=UPI00101DEAD1|nr:LysR family transcriptional regulator [Sphingosinicella sp. CPCC 101087]